MQLGAVLQRIASATSVIRTRSQDEERFVIHGGTNGEISERVRALVSKLEAIADQLEQAIA